jgi:hypothetical protein
MPKPFVLTVEVEETFVGTVLRQLKRTAGVIKVGLHDDEDLKSRANGHAPARTEKRGRKPRNHFASSGDDLVLRVLAAHKTTPLADLDAAFAKDGRAKKSCSPILTVLKQKGLISRPSLGVYALTAKGRERAKKANIEVAS